MHDLRMLNGFVPDNDTVNKEAMEKAYDPKVHQLVNATHDWVLNAKGDWVLNVTQANSTAPEAFIEIDSDHNLEHIEMMDGSLGSARRRRRRSSSSRRRRSQSGRRRRRSSSSRRRRNK